MKIKNSEMVAFINGVKEIKEKRIPIKLGYAITRNMKLMEVAAEAYNEEYQNLIGKYAEKDEEGKPKVENEEYILLDEKNYHKEINELLEIENEFEIHKIPFEELEKCDTEQFDALSIKDISLLEFMVE